MDEPGLQAITTAAGQQQQDFERSRPYYFLAQMANEIAYLLYIDSLALPVVVFRVSHQVRVIKGHW